MSGRYATPIRIAVRDLDEVLMDRRPILVAFEADDCAPCAALAPRLDEVAREFGARALVVRVSQADEPSMAARHHLLCVPTLAFWKEGREQLRLNGAVTTEALRAHFRFLLDDGPLPEPSFGPGWVVRGAFRPTTSH
jgi:thioredoxin-like negative regulator of GroEL